MRFTPQVREAAVAALVSSPVMIRTLFAAIGRGDIAVTDISSVRRAQLLKHGNAEVRGEAEVIFRAFEGGDRMQVYRKYRERLGVDADPVRGHEVFVRACSACHTYNGEGGKVGPDLTGIRNQPADAILLHILVPNYEVAPSYQTLAVVTQDGRSIAGWLAAETENSLTLRTAAGAEETIFRKNVASLSTSSASLMPEGLELTMEKADVGNIVAYLKSAP